MYRHYYSAWGDDLKLDGRENLAQFTIGLRTDYSQDRVRSR